MMEVRKVVVAIYLWRDGGGPCQQLGEAGIGLPAGMIRATSAAEALEGRRSYPPYALREPILQLSVE